MRDEKDGGPGRVLRCKMRLGTALVGVKSVDFLPLYLCSILFCSHWEPKTCKYWPGTIGTTSECIFKMSAAREKRLHALQLVLSDVLFSCFFHKSVPSDGAGTLVLFPLRRRDSRFEEFAETSAQSSE